MTSISDFATWIWANTERLRDLAVGLSAIAAMIGVPLAYLRIRAYQHARQELIAKDLYKSYLLLAVSNPDLAYPATRDVNYAKFEFDGSREKFEKYEWFLSHLLVTVSEILNLEKAKERNWPDLMRLQIWYHKYYFDVFHDGNKRFLKLHPEKVRVLVEDVRGDPTSPS